MNQEPVMLRPEPEPPPERNTSGLLWASRAALLVVAIFVGVLLTREFWAFGVAYFGCLIISIGVTVWYARRRRRKGAETSYLERAAIFFAAAVTSAVGASILLVVLAVALVILAIQACFQG